MSLQVRVEVFNLLNHPNFKPTPTAANSTLASGSFGVNKQTPDISSGNPFLSAGGARAAQIGLKILF
jgi:hypothetical protein